MPQYTFRCANENCENPEQREDELWKEPLHTGAVVLMDKPCKSCNRFEFVKVIPGPVARTTGGWTP
jgi:hypothetical protein